MMQHMIFIDQKSVESALWHSSAKLLCWFGKYFKSI